MRWSKAPRFREARPALRTIYLSAFALLMATAPLTVFRRAWAEKWSADSASPFSDVLASHGMVDSTPTPDSAAARLPSRRPARPALTGQFLPDPGHDEAGTPVPGSATAMLTWAPVAEAAGYRLYRNGSLLAALPADAGEYRDALKDCLTPQIYWLVAQNTLGDSPRSRTVIVRGGQACRPAITFVLTDPTTTTVTVKWTYTVSPLQFALYRDGMRVAYVPGDWGEATFSEEWCSGTIHRFVLSAEYAGRLPVKSKAFTSSVGNRYCYVPPTNTPTPTPTSTPTPAP